MYFAALGATQYFYVGELFGYFQFSSEFNMVETLISICTIIIFYSLFKPKGLVLAYNHLIFALLLIPSLVIFSFGGGSYLYFLVTTLCCFVVLVISCLFTPRVFVTKQLETTIMLKILLAITLCYLIGIIAQGGMSYLNFDISKVYDFREMASDNLHPAFGYLSPIVGKICVPLVIVMAAIQKKYVYLLIGVVCSVFIFGFTSHKSPLIYPFVILFLYYAPWKNLPKLILIACLSISIVSCLDFYMMVNTDNPFYGWFGSLLGRRALLVPANLNFLFIEFFNQNPLYYWAESKFSFGLIDMPYDVKAPLLIGREIFGRPDMAANTGWIGAGFNNLHIVGSLFYSVLLGLLLAYFSSLGSRIGEKFVYGASFIVVITIILSADFSTVLLTHGLIALLFTLMFFQRDSMK